MKNFFTKNIVAFVVVISLGAFAIAYQAPLLGFLVGFFYISLLLLDSQKKNPNLHVPNSE